MFYTLYLIPERNCTIIIEAEKRMQNEESSSCTWPKRIRSFSGFAHCAFPPPRVVARRKGFLGHRNFEQRTSLSVLLRFHQRPTGVKLRHAGDVRGASPNGRSSRGVVCERARVGVRSRDGIE